MLFFSLSRKKSLFVQILHRVKKLFKELINIAEIIYSFDWYTFQNIY